MSDLVYKYPLDLTGTSPENKVIGEPHTLQPGINRSAVPRYGAFYTESLVVRDADTTEILTVNDQYIPIMYHEEASERSGKEVCGGVIVTDGTVSENIIIDYQLVGGDFQNITQIILDLIDNLNLDEREVMWGDLLGRPNAFPPSHHLHDLGDVFGFEYLVDAINNLREAVLYGDIASHDELKAIIEARRQELHDRIDAFRTLYDEFIARRDNPHEVTKAQVGLGSVANHPIADQDEAEEGSLNTRYMSPLRTFQAINVFAIEPFVAHKEDYTNPHRVTKAQVGLGQVEDHPLSTRTEAENGVLDTSYMTPVRVAQAIAHQALIPLTDHENRTDNPHQVTKAQTGLGQVADYPPSNQAEAEAGTVNNRYMTPLRVAQAITEQAGTLLQAHIDDTSNPHQVTKAQVGLSQVPNWPAATLAQARAGVDPSTFMSPKRTHEFLLEHLRFGDSTVAQMEEVGAVGWYGNARTSGGFYGGTSTPISTNRVNLDAVLHATQFHGNGRNLTDMVKSQVGLGSVENLPLSNRAEAEAGTSNSRYMTPLRVSQAITEQAGSLLQSHVDDKTNPHDVTKAQVGLGNVTNDRQVARAGDTMTGDLNFNATGRGVTWNMNTDGASILFYSNGDSDTDARLEFQTNDNGNEYFRWTSVDGGTTTEQMRLNETGLNVARRVTAQSFYGNGRNLTGMVKSQVGLSNVENWNPSTQAEAQAGSNNSSYMTPLRVAQAISQQAGAAVSDHIDDTNNPHQVTKAQVGLGNVKNLSSTENSTGNTVVERNASGDIQVRLLRSEYTNLNSNIGVIMTQVDPATNNYVRPSTPGQVKAAMNLVKADVGLAAVANYSVASQAEAQSGTANNRYMTPLRVAQAISQQAGAAVSGHINDTNNPHSVTKAQVGLGNVENYSRSDYDSRYVQKAGDSMTGPLDISGDHVPGGDITLGSTQTFGLRISSNGGGVVVRAYGDDDQDSYVALNTTGAKVFNVRASDGLAISQTDFRVTSDARVKENLETIPDALNKTRQISGYTYDRTDMETTRQAGVIAQEVLKVLPEVVTENEDGRYVVSYNQLSALLIEAIKEVDSKYSQLVNVLLDNGVITDAQLT
jgi:hypothetical protein